MKITTKKIKGGATISIRATTQADRDALTEAVMSGSLMAALNGTPKASKAAAAARSAKARAKGEGK